MDIGCVWMPMCHEIPFYAHPIPNTESHPYRSNLIECAKSNPDRRILLFTSLKKVFSKYHLKLLNQLTEKYPNIQIIPIENMDFGERNTIVKIKNECDIFDSFTAYLEDRENRLIPARLEIDLVKLLILANAERELALFDFDMLPVHPLVVDPISNKQGILFAPNNSFFQLTDKIIAITPKNPFLEKICTNLKKHAILFCENTSRNLIFDLYMRNIKNEDNFDGLFSRSTCFDIARVSVEKYKEYSFLSKNGNPHFIFRNDISRSRMDNNIAWMNEQKNIFNTEAFEEKSRQRYRGYIISDSTAFKETLEQNLKRFLENFHKNKISKFLGELKLVESILLFESFTQTQELNIHYSKFLFRQHLENVFCSFNFDIMQEFHLQILDLLFRMVEKPNAQYITHLFSRILNNKELMESRHHFDGTDFKKLCHMLFAQWKMEVTPDLLLAIFQLIPVNICINDYINELANLLLSSDVLCLQEDLEKLFYIIRHHYTPLLEDEED